MKVAVVFLVVIVAFAVDAAQSRKHKDKHVKHEHEDFDDSEEGEGEWPQPEAVRKFEVPEGFTASPPPEANAKPSTPSSGKHHHKKTNVKTLKNHD